PDPGVGVEGKALPAASSSLWTSEHNANFVPNLVYDEQRGVVIIQKRIDLSEESTGCSSTLTRLFLTTNNSLVVCGGVIRWKIQFLELTLAHRHTNRVPDEHDRRDGILLLFA